MTKCRRVDHVGRHVLEGRCANEAHVHLKLVLEDLDRANDALVPVRRVGICAEGVGGQCETVRVRVGERAAPTEEGATDADSGRAQGDGLEHVSCTANATVDAASYARRQYLVSPARTRTEARGQK